MTRGQRMAGRVTILRSVSAVSSRSVLSTTHPRMEAQHNRLPLMLLVTLSPAKRERIKGHLKQPASQINHKANHPRRKSPIKVNRKRLCNLQRKVSHPAVSYQDHRAALPNVLSPLQSPAPFKISVNYSPPMFTPRPSAPMVSHSNVRSHVPIARFPSIRKLFLRVSSERVISMGTSIFISGWSSVVPLETTGKTHSRRGRLSQLFGAFQHTRRSRKCGKGQGHIAPILLLVLLSVCHSFHLKARSALDSMPLEASHYLSPPSVMIASQQVILFSQIGSSASIQ